MQQQEAPLRYGWFTAVSFVVDNFAGFAPHLTAAGGCKSGTGFAFKDCEALSAVEKDMRSFFGRTDDGCRRCSAEEAVKCIQPGQRVFVGSSCGAPQALVKALFLATRRFADVEIVRLFAMEMLPISLMAECSMDRLFNLRSFYSGSGEHPAVSRHRRHLTPIRLSAVPKLFRTGRLPIHAALIQTAPPDADGYLSLGISVDITLAAALSAQRVLVQVNPNMPRVGGPGRIHLRNVDAIVEQKEPLLTVVPTLPEASDQCIADLVAALIEDGSTLQVGAGGLPDAVVRRLAHKKDLGIHTPYMTDSLMALIQQGAVTNTRKGLHPGKSVASGAVGSQALYRFLHANDAVSFFPADYVNDPDIIGAHADMVCINTAAAMDLSGQVAADARPTSHFSEICGMTDFIRGAMKAENGKSIILLPSTSPDGRLSRIHAALGDLSIVVPREDVHYVVTEFGAVNLFGKNLQERAMAMISIAHPAFREHLFHQAREKGCIGAGRLFRKSITGRYPLDMEASVCIDGRPLRVRPAKPVDLRRIQEFFYNMDKEDIAARFLHDRRIFSWDAVEPVAQIDYQNDMALVALTGPFGFGRVVGVAEYFRNSSTNTAEVSIAVAAEFKRRGLGRILLFKLAEAARLRKMDGLFAYTAPQNRAMLQLFKTLPYTCRQCVENNMILMSCRFDEPRC